MDYINTNLSLDDVKNALEGLTDTPEKIRTLRDLQTGHDTMLASCNLIIEKNKAAIFRLFKRKMTSHNEGCTNAYRLGLMCALGELGIQFSIRNEKLLKVKMDFMEKRERKYNAMKKVLHEEQ